MIRVDRSHGQKWLDALPVFSRQQLFVGLGIYLGVVNGVEGLVVEITFAEGVYSLHVVESSDYTGFLYYDKTTDNFKVAEVAGTNWASGVIQGAGLWGFLRVGEVTYKDSVEHNEISYKLIEA